MSVIRLRRDADIEPLARFLPLTHEQDGYPVRRSSCTPAFLALPEGAIAWVIEQDGEPVGHAMLLTGIHTRIPESLSPERPIGALGRLFVSPDARGQGHSATLIGVVCEHARAAGLQPMLEVAEGTPAVAYYERRGWRYLGSATTPWVDDAGEHRVVRYYAAPA